VEDSNADRRVQRPYREKSKGFGAPAFTDGAGLGLREPPGLAEGARLTLRDTIWAAGECASAVSRAAKALRFVHSVGVQVLDSPGLGAVPQSSLSVPIYRCHIVPKVMQKKG